MPVTRIDDRPIGNGVPGSVATALRAEFHRHAEGDLGAKGELPQAQDSPEARFL